MTQLMEQMSGFLQQNLWLGLLIALCAGILSSLTPCSLSGVPLVVAYTGGSAVTRKRAFVYSLLFCAGMTVVFVILGVVMSLLGRAFLFANAVWYLLLGALMTAMALQMWGVINVLPKKCGVTPSRKKGAAGAFLTGMLAAVFASPCATPVLVSILAVVGAGGQSVLFGTGMLLFYSVGHSVLLVAAGTAVGFARQLSLSDKYRRAAVVVNAAMGVAVFLLALYLFYTAFS